MTIKAYLCFAQEIKNSQCYKNLKNVTIKATISKKNKIAGSQSCVSVIAPRWCSIS